MAVFPNPIVADHSVFKKDLFFFGAATNIVDDQRGALRNFIGDDPYVQDSVAEVPSNDVTRAVGFSHVEVLVQGNLMPLEIPHEVRHATVIDIFVRFLESPFSRIRTEILPHILVDFLLKIDSYFPNRTNNHITANPRMNGNITTGVIERFITWVDPSSRRPGAWQQ